MAPDIGQPAVTHAGRTRGLAGATGKAPIEMELRLGGNRAALEHLLDQIDPPARAVELVAEQLIRRTRRGAETAVHAGAQNRLGFTSLRGVLDEIGEMGFQAQ